jgi:hypothetical protein
MSNDLPDILYNLKCSLSTDTTDNNNKAIKIVNIANRTHTLNAFVAGSTSSYITTGEVATIGAYVRHNPLQYQIVNYTTGTNTPANAISAYTVRLTLITNTFQEITEDIVFNIGDTTKTTTATNILNCNFMELISGSIDAGQKVACRGVGLTTLLNECVLEGNSLSVLNCRFVVPLGYVAKLSSIDNFSYRNESTNLSNSNLSLQYFLTTASNVSNPLFQYTLVQSPFQKNYGVNGAYTFTAGQTVMGFRTESTGATSTFLTITFTLYPAGNFL